MSGGETVRLFIGGLSERISKEDLLERCSRYGEVVSVDLRSLNYASGEWMKSFAFVNLKGRSCLAKCQSQLTGNWKGGKIVVGSAAEDPAARRLREAAAVKNGIEETPVRKKRILPPVPRYCQQKGAQPGTVFEQNKKWVVTKFQRMMPILKSRSKCRKVPMLYDPAKRCHQIKVLDRGDGKSTRPEVIKPVEGLTWMLPDEQTKRDIYQYQAVIQPVRRPANRAGPNHHRDALTEDNDRLKCSPRTTPPSSRVRNPEKTSSAVNGKQAVQRTEKRPDYSFKNEDLTSKVPTSGNRNANKPKLAVKSTIPCIKPTKELEKPGDCSMSQDDQINKQISYSVIEVTPLPSRSFGDSSSTVRLVDEMWRSKKSPSSTKKSVEVGDSLLIASERFALRSRIVGDLDSLEHPGQLEYEEESAEGESEGSADEIDPVIIPSDVESLESNEPWFDLREGEELSESEKEPETQATVDVQPPSLPRQAIADDDELLVVPMTSEISAPHFTSVTNITAKSHFDSSDSENDTVIKRPKHSKPKYGRSRNSNSTINVATGNITSKFRLRRQKKKRKALAKHLPKIIPFRGHQ